MKSVLEQLYDGEIYPAEQVNVRTEGYQKMRREHYSHYEDFIEQLKAFNPPLSERFILFLLHKSKNQNFNVR